MIFLHKRWISQRHNSSISHHTEHQQEVSQILQKLEEIYNYMYSKKETSKTKNKQKKKAKQKRNPWNIFVLIKREWSYFILTYNQFHNVLRLFDVLPNLPFTTSEMMADYYL